MYKVIYRDNDNPDKNRWAELETPSEVYLWGASQDNFIRKEVIDECPGALSHEPGCVYGDNGVLYIYHMI